jgi:hypothetical protein
VIGHRTPPGPRLSIGRIRVDAARAIAKLRDYQLVDRRTWVLEAIRAAIASGARRVVLDGDANDVWLAWDGEPWPTAVLPALFDELVSPEPARESQHLRLLGTAVNSALGLEPAYVDVIAIGADGAHRVRYTPEVLVPVDAGTVDDDTPLRQLEVTTVPHPDRAPTAGMLVHLRRRIGIEALSNLLHGAPRELAIARAACMDASVPIEIGGTVVGRAHHVRDLITAPLGHGLDGFVAVVDPDAPRPGASTTGAMLEVAEHGVLLATYPIELIGVGDARGPVPLRVYVDAPRMPTNASRSEVQRDAHPIAAAEARAIALVPALIDALVTELGSAPAVSGRRRLLRSAAIDLLASRAAGSNWAYDATFIAPPLDRLAALPLLRNAVGAERAVNARWILGLAHDGGRPYPAELAPWLEEIVWFEKGDRAGRLLGYATSDGRAVRKRAKRARKAVRAQARFLGHTVREPRVSPRSPPRALITIGATMPGTCGAPDLFRALAGEVAVLGTDGRSELVLLHHGREIETVELASPIAFQAVLGCDDLLPTERYRGVVRDSTYARVEAAARAAVVRGAEAIAIARAGTPSAAADFAFVVDATIMRRAFALATEIDRALAPASPLYQASIWPTADGRWASLAELGRERVVGAVNPGSPIRTLLDRTIVEADAAERATLDAALDETLVVHYTDLTELLDPAADHARRLASEQDGVALAVRRPGVASAIVVSRSGSWIYHHHLGKRLDLELYHPRLIDCEVIIDDDSLIPNPAWDEIAVDREAVRGRSYDDLERALLRAIAGAILGDPEPDLVRPDATAVGLDHPAGVALCKVIAGQPDPTIVLGAELVRRLRAFKVIEVLGQAQPRSLDEAAALHPTGPIPYVSPSDACVIPGWNPLVCSESRALAFGKLLGREVIDATAELAQRRLAAVRAGRLAELRARPPVNLDLPAMTPGIATEPPAPTGLIGVGDHDRLVIEVHVERRWFDRITVADDLPLLAILDLAETAIDETFTQVRPEAREKLIAAVRVVLAPTLIDTVLAREPRTLIEDPRLTRLLARVLMKRGLSDVMRNKLRAAAMFPRVQGGHASMTDAVDERVVRTASFAGAWTGPVKAEPPQPLDTPVLQVADGPDGADRRAVIQALAHNGVADVSEAINRLQSRRRIALGLVAPPVLPGVERALVRRLDQLGTVGELLGFGEVGLVDDDRSRVLPFANGRPGEPIEIDVLPPIRIAVEAPDLVAAGALSPAAVTGRGIQQIAIELVRELCSVKPPTLPVWARRRLRRAVFTGWLDHADLRDVPALETTDGAWRPWSVIEEQRRAFGQVWFTAPLSSALPLDPARIALRLTGAEGEAVSGRFDLVEATEELRLDQIARHNMAKPPATTLKLSDSEIGAALHAGVEMTDPGGRRGWVVPLAPAGARRRGVRAHRDMFRFEPASDPCAWPTLTVVDDPALAPDRTWTHAAEDDAWAALTARVVSASVQALRATAPPPADAVARRWIEPSRATVIRTGWLWLAGPADHPQWLHGPGAVRVMFADRGETYAPPAARPVRGWIAVNSAWTSSLVIDLERLFIESYTVMLREAAADTTRDDVACHVAVGLLRGTLDASDATLARFRCFRPEPLDAGELLDLIGDQRARIPLIEPDERATGPSIVADGSALSRLLIERLGSRAVRPGKAVPPPRVPLPGLTPVVRPVAPPPLPPPPAPPHRLRGLADALWARLHEIGVAASHVTEIAIASDRSSPVIAHEHGVIILAGEASMLAAVDNARQARSAWAPAAIDALAAHVVTVLNVELTSVTDAAEAHAVSKLLDTTA